MVNPLVKKVRISRGENDFCFDYLAHSLQPLVPPHLSIILLSLLRLLGLLVFLGQARLKRLIEKYIPFPPTKLHFSDIKG